MMKMEIETTREIVNKHSLMKLSHTGKRKFDNKKWVSVEDIRKQLEDLIEPENTRCDGYHILKSSIRKLLQKLGE